MMALVKYFLNNKIAVNVFVLGLFFLGLISFTTIPKEGMPGIELNQILVTTVYPGASPEDVELNVTVPLEEEIREITGIGRASSVGNLSLVKSISLFFKSVKILFGTFKDSGDTK